VTSPFSDFVGCIASGNLHHLLAVNLPKLPECKSPAEQEALKQRRLQKISKSCSLPPASSTIRIQPRAPTPHVTLAHAEQ
jgi:hypothetical protein